MTNDSFYVHATTGDLGGTAAAPTVAKIQGTAIAAPPTGGAAATEFLRGDGTWAAPAGGGGASLSEHAVITANPAPAVVATFYPCDTTSAAFPLTLPAAPADQSQVAAKLIIQGTTGGAGNAVTITTGGSGGTQDTINKAGGSTTLPLSVPGQGAVLQYKPGASGPPGVWYVMGDDLPMGQLDARYGVTVPASPVTWGGTATVTVSAAQVVRATLTSATATTLTITPATSAATVAQNLTLYITQPASGSVGTVVWPGSVTWLGGSAPSLSPVLGGLTVVTLQSPDGGVTWYGSAVAGASLPLSVANGGTGVTALPIAGGMVAGGATSSSPSVQVSMSVAYATAGVLSGTAVYSAGVLVPTAAGSYTALSVDGQAVAQGQLILVKNEASGQNNGVYQVNSAGTTGTPGAPYSLQRYSGMAASALVSGTAVFVQGGSTLTGTAWMVQGVFTGTLGTNSIPWVQVGGGSSTAAGLASATTTVAVSSAAAPAAGQGLVAASSTSAAWVPVDTAALYTHPVPALAATFPRWMATSNSSALTSGSLYLVQIPCPQGITVSTITMFVNTSVKTGGQHGWYVFLDHAGQVLAVTADQTDAATVWGTAHTGYPLNVGTPFTTTYTGIYYVGVMVAETSGTTPTFAVAGTLATGPGAGTGISGATVYAGVATGYAIGTLALPPFTGTTPYTLPPVYGNQPFYAYLT